jgi:hypothetical protein
MKVKPKTKSPIAAIAALTCPTVPRGHPGSGKSSDLTQRVAGASGRGEAFGPGWFQTDRTMLKEPSNAALVPARPMAKKTTGSPSAWSGHSGGRRDDQR